MGNIGDIIREHPFFENFPERLISSVLPHAVLATFNPGQVLIEKGKPARHFYLIESGVLMLEEMVENYGTVVLDKLYADDIVGWSWCCPPYRWHFTVRALHETQVIILDAELLKEVMSADPELGFYVMRRVSSLMEQRLQATRAKLLSFYASFPEPKENRPEWQRLF